MSDSKKTVTHLLLYTEAQSPTFVVLTLLTAERIWFKRDLYLQFIPPMNLWKICIDLRPFPKYFNEPFSRMLRSPRSNNLEIQNDEDSR